MTNVQDFGAKGDGKTDDTAALTHAIQRGDGELYFPRGDYRISRPLYISLQQFGRLSIRGDGGTARITMSGSGPAIHLVGTHGGTANPESVHDQVWKTERMPIIQDLEIVGAHNNADGIRLDGVMQPTLSKLLIRRCRHGVHIVKRNRNVDIANCHIYENRGIGIYFDHVNLHQTNIHGNHISYCKAGGIQIVGSEIRNLQICSNDIEYNYDKDANTSADILFDCREGTVREGTITGCTIQAKQSPNGANVRFLGVGKDNPNRVGLFTITGNLIGSQETAIHLQACRGVVVSGNCIYSGYHHSLVAEDSEHLVIASNSIDHNPEYRGKSTDQLVLNRCQHVNVNGILLQHSLEAEKKVDSSISIEKCKYINVTGCQIHNPRSTGIHVDDCQTLRISDSIIASKQDNKMSASIEVKKSHQVMVVNNVISKGSKGSILMDKEAGTQRDNMEG